MGGENSGGHMGGGSEKPMKTSEQSVAGSANGCRLTVVPNSVLTDISVGAAQMPDYNHKFTDTCNLGECSKICEKASCNYFMRSNSNGLTYFYSVAPAKLNPAKFTESVFYDSFVPQCAPGVEGGQLRFFFSKRK